MDYADIETLASILREHKVEVVISALAYGALPAQWTIADAAKEAGVKLFVPSEYGMPTEGGKEGHIAIKSEVAGKSATNGPRVGITMITPLDYVKSLGLPVMRVYVRSLVIYLPYTVPHPYLVRTASSSSLFRG